MINDNIGHGLFLVNDIEEELGLPQGTSSKPYIALSHINREDFQISDSMLDKITAIYD